MADSSFDGLLVLDKPGDMSSREAVDRALRWFPRRTRIGHTGTLDPLATGVLVLCLGNATRLADYVQRMRKTYRSTFRLGTTSDTDDAEGTLTPTGAAPPTREAIDAALPGLVGTLDQVPPAFSAAKVTGKRAYALARKGQDVELTPRPVQVYSIEVLGYRPPDLDVEIHCGKGTYVRSLARDLGQALGCGAYVAALRRTRVGPFVADDGARLEMGREQAVAKLLPAGLALAELPSITVGAMACDYLRHGRAIPLPEGLTPPPGVEIAAFDGAGDVVAVVRVSSSGELLRPAKVLG